MKWIITLVTLLVAMAATAGDRQETIKQIMIAQGLVKTYEQQFELGRQQSREQGRVMLDQIMANLNPNPEFIKRFEDAFQIFMSEIETPWGADEVVEVWAKFYGEYFTDEELDQLLVYYQTPLAQKEIIATRQALVSFTNHFAEAGKPIAENAISNYITNLKLIAKECKCRR